MIAPAPRRPDDGVILALAGDDSELVRELSASGGGLTVVRRCADTAELLSTCLAGLARLAVVDVELDDVDRTVVARLERAGVRGVLLAPADDVERWLTSGWTVVGHRTPTAEVRAHLQAVAAASPATGGRRAHPPGFDPAGGSAGSAVGGARGRSDGEGRQGPLGSVGAIGAAELPSAPPGAAPGAGRALPESASGSGAAPVPNPGAGAVGRGRIAVVWGPHGAPGRTMVAASLAYGLAGGRSCVLIDADVEAPSLVQVLGLEEDSSSLATAARLAARSRLDDEALESLLVPVCPGMSLLTGLGRSGRWRELPPAAMTEVIARCRRAAGWTVVDLAAGDLDEEIDDFTLEPGRRAMAAALIRQADVVVVVGGADPVGIRRLLQHLGDLAEEGLEARLEVVVNRVRRSAAGDHPDRAVREALARFGGLDAVLLLPEDAAADDCLMAALPVLAGAPASPLGRALAVVVDRVDPAAGARAGASKARRRRRGPRWSSTGGRRTVQGGQGDGRRSASPPGTGAPAGASVPPPPPPERARVQDTRRLPGGRHRG